MNKKAKSQNFKNFEECISWAKKSVYLIARGRKIPMGEKREMIKWVTIGTGFIAAPGKMLTAGHVINDSRKGAMFEHKKGDKYALIKHEDGDTWHYRLSEPEIEKDLFVYKEEDLAVINLEDEFYEKNGKVFLDKETHIKVSDNFRNIGTEVGVLGYPLSNLTFENGNIFKPMVGNILLRCDKGVINCRYKTSPENYLYEFTMAFNPGNSGGPIFDIKTGELISIVTGFKSMVINIKENELNDDLREKIGIEHYTPDSYLEVMHANYSVGFGTPSFKQILKKHKIL